MGKEREEGWQMQDTSDEAKPNVNWAVGDWS